MEHKVLVYLVCMRWIVGSVRGEASIRRYVLAAGNVLNLFLADDNLSATRRSLLDVLLGEALDGLACFLLLLYPVLQVRDPERVMQNFLLLLRVVCMSISGLLPIRVPILAHLRAHDALVAGLQGVRLGFAEGFYLCLPLAVL